MLIAWDNLADDATLTASSEQASAPGANVQNEHVAKKWYTAAGVTSATLLLDLTTSQSCAILALLGANLTAAATIRLRGSDSDATGATGEKYDSGTISAGAKADYGSVYHSFTAARYWLLNIADASLSLLQVGRLFLGPKWTPTYNQVAGWSVAVIDESKISESYGFQSFADVRPLRRVLDFTLFSISESEMFGNAFAMAMASGINADVLAVQDTAAAGYISEQSVFGLCQGSQPIVNDQIGIFRQKFTIKERL